MAGPSCGGGPSVANTCGGTGLSGVANIGTGTGLIFSDITDNIIDLRTLQAGSGVSITTTGDNIVITASVSAPGYESLSTNSFTNPSANIEVTDFYMNTGGVATLTLANPSPLVLGLKKEVIISQATAGSSLNLNITTFTNHSGGGVQFTNVGQSVALIWSQTGWCINGAGATVY